MTGGAQGLARGATDNARSLDASVVVCTHDRADSLRVTLASLERLRGLDDLTWEVVVVDNASGDETPAVIEACARRGHLPLRPVFEPRLGHARARNAGVRAARGQVVAFTDDDVAVDPGWLRAVVEGFVSTGRAPSAARSSLRGARRRRPG